MVVGSDIHGELGIGSETASTDKFMKISFDNPENIVNIFGNNLGSNLIISNDNGELKIFYCGYTHGTNFFSGDVGNAGKLFKNTEYANKNVLQFVEISNRKNRIKQT